MGELSLISAIFSTFHNAPDLYPDYPFGALFWTHTLVHRHRGRGPTAPVIARRISER